MRVIYMKIFLQGILLVAMTCGGWPEAFAQTVSVSGRVTSAANNEPLPGVTVVVKGTAIGSSTDVNGRYSLSGVDPTATLTFSYIGFIGQEVPVNGRSTINASLSTDSKALQELVVVGYGTQERKDLTGAVSSVSAEEIRAFPVASFDQALQGRAPGVQVSSNTGQPGGGINVRIRGVGTVNNNDPLYVIDGIPVFNDPQAVSANLTGGAQLQNPLAMLNPNDIESIEILKDASATAIYGARANNGVVIITTKRGRDGKLRVEFETFRGFNQLVDNVDLLDGPTWAGWYASLLRNSARGNDPSLPELDAMANNPATPTYDWLGEGIRRGSLQSHQLNLSGGNQNSQFYIGANFYDEEGTVINSGFKRYSLRVNSDHTVSKRIKVGNTLSLSRTDQQLAITGLGNNAVFQRLQSVAPIRPIYTPDGRYAGGQGLVEANLHPIANLHNDQQSLMTNRILGSLFGDLELLPGLTFRSSWSVDQIFSAQEVFNPPFEVEGGQASRFPINSSLATQNRNSFTWFTDNYFTYQKTIAEKHSINGTLGHSAQQTNNRFYGANVQNFISGDYPYLSAGINQGNVNGGEERNALLSYFARVNYSFADKYLFTATVRRDGSSRFGRDNQFGTFPALSVGWRLSEEGFMRHVTPVNNLKLRASWGQSGGQEIGNYSAFNILGSNFNYIIGDQIVGGTAPLSLANSRLQWEATEQTNLGMDVGLFSNRVNFTADYFIKNTTNLLLRVLPPVEAGAISNPFANLGKIQNRGIELGLNTVNLDGSFQWTSDFNFTSIQNKVLALANNDEPRLNTPGIAHFSAPTFITQVGGSIGQFFIHEVEGIFQSWDEIYASPRQNTPVNASGNPSLPQTNITQQTSPGDLKFRDVNGDGVIDANDRVVAGKIIPDFTWGFTNNFRYKGVGLSVFVMGVHGVDIYNGARAARERMNQAVQHTVSVLSAWTPDNPNTNVPRAIITDPNLNNRASTRWLEDGSFIRVRNIRLSYDLPNTVTERLKIANVQVYASAVNALTFTKYTGFDPELGNLNQNPELGNLDAGMYPQSRQYLLGLRVGF
jgi:TonB-dependent starch-binding outer membrane protein SusC